MSVSFKEILNAFDFADAGENRAFLCRKTGKIYLHSEFSDFDEFNDELPDDVEDEGKYLAIPDKRGNRSRQAPGAGFCARISA
jgi:hypothetical protein